MIGKPSSCGTCVLYGDGCGFAEPDGVGSLGVLIVGEANGEMEANDGLPFRPHGAAGSLLERCFRRNGYTRDQFRITNVLRCRPPHNLLDGEKYEAEAIANCQHFLDTEIARTKPKAILALGGIAARTLTGMAGHKQGIQAIRGFILNSPRYGIPVIPSLHPAFLRRGYMKWLGLLIRDMQLAVQVATKGLPETMPFQYDEYPSVERAEAFLADVLANPELVLAYDIETNYSQGEDEGEVVQDGKQILTVQFALHPGTGISMMWNDSYIPIIKALLATPNPKLVHNGYNFDNPILTGHGCVINGDLHDTQWAWHHLQPDLPRGLQSVVSIYCPEVGPWKHTAQIDPAIYGCKDVDYLLRFWPKLQRDLKDRGVWDCYERHVRQLWPILADMSARGLPVDPVKQEAFRANMQTEMRKVNDELQALYPEHLKELHPPNGFVHNPADTTGMAQKEFICQHTKKVLCECVDKVNGEITGWTKSTKSRHAACKGTGWVKWSGTGPITRWCTPLPFTPSPPQLIRYMHYKRHKVPKVIGGDRDTTAKLFIERMARDYKDPLYKGLLQYRSLQKFLGAYIWSLGPDNRVHAEFKYSPATGQLAASNPNVLTIPTEYKAGPMAKTFRETISATTGKVLVEHDFSSFHTSTFALEARDPEYFRLANTIGDPHSFLAAVMLKLNTPEKMLAMSNDEMKQYFRFIKDKYKAIRDGQAKPAILGYALGLGGNKLYEMNRFNPLTGSGFNSKREATNVIEMLRAIFPRGYAYQNEVRALASRQGYLLNKHGYIRWFWDVLRNNPLSGAPELGEQSEEAIAFNVQADAHGHLKDALLQMQQLGWLERYGLINVVHDSVVFEVEQVLLEECLANVSSLMEQPSKVLVDPVLCPGGLVVKVEAKYGPNMAEMKGWKR